MIGDSYIKVIGMDGANQITHVARADWINGSVLQGFNEADNMILWVNASCVSAVFINSCEGR